MIDFLSLLRQTAPYRTIKSEKERDSLSHAYLILCADKDNLKNYLKLVAELILCNENEPCRKCRTCNLISEENYPDVIFYPKPKKNKDKNVVMTEDITNLIEESYYKPIEGEKKIFIIEKAESMNASCQNKLLKTLEEPPENVIIILGATSEYPLLSTVKSRVKKLEIAPFNNDVLYKAIESECEDKEKLKEAINCSDGTVGKTLELYNDEDFIATVNAVNDVIVNMNKSSEVLTYSTKITNQKIGIDEFLSVLELRINDMLKITNGVDKKLDEKSYEASKNAQGFTEGSLIYILEKVIHARKQRIANMNSTMLLEWMLFQILEGKHKWQKL